MTRNALTIVCEAPFKDIPVGTSFWINTKYYKKVSKNVCVDFRRVQKEIDPDQQVVVSEWTNRLLKKQREQAR